MRKRLLFELLTPVSSWVAAQLAHPRGWFGRLVMTRVLNRGNRELIGATLVFLELAPEDQGVQRLAGVDPSEAAVRALEARASRGLLPLELRVRQGTVEDLPFGDAEFDAILSTNTVYFWPELGRAMAELRRVLAPNGRVAIGFSSPEKLQSFRSITQHGFVLHAPDELVAEAGKAGFKGVRLVALHGTDTEGDYVLVGSGS